MAITSSDAPSINANYAATVLNRAAEIVAGNAICAGLGCDANDALRQAVDEFRADEAHEQEKKRTYARAHLRKDLVQHLVRLKLVPADTWGALTEWSVATDAAVVAQALREAAPVISRMVEERTRRVAKVDSMTEKELMEYHLMQKVAVFLIQQGLRVKIEWYGEDTSDPIDYRGTVDGIAWAFELTELRIDAKGSHRKAGNPNERQSIEQQLKKLAEPIPQAPDGPDVLRQVLDKAVKHGGNEAKLNQLNGARYCLVLHNQQFLNAAAWEEITLPDFGAFDAVLILHQDSVAIAHTWEVPVQDGFEKRLPSQNMSDLSDIAEFKLSGMPHIDPTAIRAVWRQIEESGITDAEIYEAVAQVRAEKCRR